MPSVDLLRSLRFSLNEAVDSYITDLQTGSDAPTTEADAKRVADAAASITQITRDPLRHVISLCMGQTQNLAIRIAIDLDLFNIVQEVTTLKEMAEKSGADPSLLTRIMRLLTATGVFAEVAAGENRSYGCTPESLMLRNPSVRDWTKLCFDFWHPTWGTIPPFLRKSGYKDIVDPSSNPMMSQYGCNYFEYLNTHPEQFDTFSSAMKAQDLVPKYTIPKFPYDDGVASFKSGVYMVDIGGGQGQFLSHLAEAFPDLPGRKILQDLPSVVEGMGDSPSFEVMPHDFFTPQPVHGAKYYHIRSVLHNWSDDRALAILENVRPALKAGYSRLLLQEIILSELGCPAREAMTDLHMWLLLGMERTEAHYKELLAKAGFEFVRVVMAKGRPFGVIEAKLAGDA